MGLFRSERTSNKHFLIACILLMLNSGIMRAKAVPTKQGQSWSSSPDGKEEWPAEITEYYYYFDNVY